MHIEQLYTGCLAQAAYYIESEGEAAVIDPIRDFQVYSDLAKSRNATIKFVFETHFHADFVSGHIDLAKETGATIVYGPGAQTGYNIHVAHDGEEFKIGALTLVAMHTPGHTLESTCYLLKDEKGTDHSIFTGDTLFVGDVGRPDLLDGIMTKEELAGKLFESLNSKIKPLADGVIVYPGHGPGSSCGKNMGPERQSTIGIQKQTNYALQNISKEEFISQVTEGITAPPSYFFKDAVLNKNGYLAFSDVLEKGEVALDVAAFEKQMEHGVQVLDTRIPDEFEQGFIPGALNIGLNGQFAIWAATLLDLKQPLVLVCPEGKEKESVVRLSRVGFDNILGYLEGGFEAWKSAGKNIDLVISIEPDEFALDHKFGDISVLDVRKKGEFDEGHVEGAEFFTLQDLPADLDRLDKQKDYYIHCAGGYRSMIAASMLKAKGIVNVKNVYGGFGKIKETGIALVLPKKQKKAETV